VVAELLVGFAVCHSNMVGGSPAAIGRGSSSGHGTAGRGIARKQTEEQLLQQSQRYVEESASDGPRAERLLLH